MRRWPSAAAVNNPSRCWLLLVLVASVGWLAWSLADAAVAAELLLASSSPAEAVATATAKDDITQAMPTTTADSVQTVVGLLPADMASDLLRTPSPLVASLLELPSSGAQVRHGAVGV